jgi:hypothetical protein
LAKGLEERAQRWRRRSRGVPPCTQGVPYLRDLTSSI